MVSKILLGAECNIVTKKGDIDVETIKKLKNAGVKFSLGSDAHKLMKLLKD